MSLSDEHRGTDAGASTPEGSAGAGGQPGASDRDDRTARTRGKRRRPPEQFSPPEPDHDGTEVLARLIPSPGRRGLGTGMLVVLGAILFWTVLAHPPQSPGWLVFLLAGAALSVFCARQMWRATSHTLVLTHDALYEEHGRVLARVDEIASVDRGLFAFKPSNGFLLKLHTPAPRAWSLGMWWRAGRRIGVGGVTPGGQGRAMADILTALLMERSR